METKMIFSINIEVKDDATPSEISAAFRLAGCRACSEYYENGLQVDDEINLNQFGALQLTSVKNATLFRAE
jgi:hypothetical protein